ncbi:MAG: CRTAC1 family protein [Pirellulaceae bacterium]|nr:CRTAC1 family protein [Pirellulaceae bacterium]
MTQPLDRNREFAVLGEIDEEAGEFWVDNPFMFQSLNENLSAYERNRLFLNVDGKTFLDASYASVTDIDSDSRAVMAADFDRDGAPDLLVGSVGGGPLRLFLNRFPRDLHRLTIELVGVQSNRSGIGARVTAQCGGRQIVRDVFAANGFQGQSPAVVELGVDAAERIDRLTIRWPNNQTQVLTDLPVDGHIQITEGHADFEFTPRID